MRFCADWKTAILGFFLFLPILGCAQQAGDMGMESVLDSASQTQPAAENEIALVSGGEIRSGTPSTRKIIYTAEVEMVVKDFAEFERQIAGAISSHDGFVAERSTNRSHGDHRGGSWVIRIPVENYDQFLSGLSSLGFARSRSETSDDVTEAYVDLQARISNKRKLEERIIGMLEERPGKLSELMEIERELSRVREEIERMEGRMRVLTDQTSLATVRLQVSEEATYEPPAAPTFGDQIASAWANSIGAIGQIASGLMIMTVAVAPWIAIALPFTVLVYRFRGRIREVLKHEVATPGN